MNMCEDRGKVSNMGIMEVISIKGLAVLILMGTMEGNMEVNNLKSNMEVNNLKGNMVSTNTKVMLSHKVLRLPLNRCLLLPPHSRSVSDLKHLGGKQDQPVLVRHCSHLMLTCLLLILAVQILHRDDEHDMTQPLPLSLLLLPSLCFLDKLLLEVVHHQWVTATQWCHDARRNLRRNSTNSMVSMNWMSRVLSTLVAWFLTILLHVQQRVIE